ncbi:MAG: hypothetical protein IIX06_04655 [Bacteroidales bacterium]|nr:hypothetical protein [Bacteroidales bacterium]
MITFDKKNFVLVVAFVIVAMICSFTLGTHRAEPVIEEVVKYVEVIPENKFDISILESWDGDFSDGKIHMIGAWLYGHDNNSNPIVIDENGELWTLTNHDIKTEDFLLLWIADNNTVEDVQDDVVLKIWVEKYEGVG